jgi:hypothetical protein
VHVLDLVCDRIQVPDVVAVGGAEIDAPVTRGDGVDARCQADPRTERVEGGCVGIDSNNLPRNVSHHVKAGER